LPMSLLTFVKVPAAAAYDVRAGPQRGLDPLLEALNHCCFQAYAQNV